MFITTATSQDWVVTLTVLIKVHYSQHLINQEENAMEKLNSIEMAQEELQKEEVNLYGDEMCVTVTRVHCLTDCFWSNDCYISCDN